MTTTRFLCKHLVELVTAYLDNALSDEDRARFEYHLGRCQGCQNYLQQMKQTIELTGRLTEDLIEPDQKQALLGAFRTWNQKQNTDPGL